MRPAKVPTTIDEKEEFKIKARFVPAMPPLSIAKRLNSLPEVSIKLTKNRDNGNIDIKP